jgi:hypothetical protein
MAATASGSFTFMHFSFLLDQPLHRYASVNSNHEITRITASRTSGLKIDRGKTPLV